MTHLPGLLRRRRPVRPDWSGLRAQYGGLLDQAVTRWDVNFLIGEVNASHTYLGGGDTGAPPRRGVGLLGADWSLENGAYRIARIVRGAPWDIEDRSPLDEPGVDVDEGDYCSPSTGTPSTWRATRTRPSRDCRARPSSSP